MIVFYHEMDSMSSGAAALIVNLIRGLVNKGKSITLINFRNGAMHQELYDLREELLSVIDNDRHSIKSFAKSITADDTIITTHFYSVFRHFKKANPKILFYCVGHVQIFEANRYFKKFNFLFLTRRLVKLLRKQNGILFIEQNAFKKSMEMLSLDAEGFAILPIPVSAPEKNLYMEKGLDRSRNSINFTYVGRAVDTKIFPVRKMIKDILEIKGRKEICLQIVTDDAANFDAQLPQFSNNSLSVRFQENISQNNLDAFLLTNSAIHFSQATSALEGAKLGIPTILVDFAFTEFPEMYRYKFIYQTDPAYIGTDVSEENEFSGMTMTEIVEVMNDTSKLEQISKECYSYVLKNHDVSIITSVLDRIIDHCSTHLSDIKKYLVRYWF